MFHFGTLHNMLPNTNMKGLDFLQRIAAPVGEVGKNYEKMGYNNTVTAFFLTLRGKLMMELEYYFLPSQKTKVA